MDDATQRHWDIILKTVGLIGLMLSGSWTYYKFREDRRTDLMHQQEAEKKDDIARQEERNKFIFERQASIYLEVAQEAATIATSHSEGSARAAADQFYQHYFGDMVVVEDRRVELAMVEFSLCMNASRKNCSRRVTVDQRNEPLSNEKRTSLPDATIQNFSLELAACFRSALSADRNINFGKLIEPVSSCPYD